MAKKGKVFPAVSDITLDDCMLMYGKVPGIQDWYEDHYYLVLGEIDGYDFFLCSALVVPIALLPEANVKVEARVGKRGQLGEVLDDRYQVVVHPLEAHQALTVVCTRPLEAVGDDHLL